MEKLAILDCGGQYTKVIDRKVRELGVKSDIFPINVNPEQLSGYQGIILSGGPESIYSKEAVKCDDNLFKLQVPILGICYGMHLINDFFGGVVSAEVKKEYGQAYITVSSDCPLFAGLSEKQLVLMSHGDSVKDLADGFVSCAESTEGTEFIAGICDTTRQIYAVQFHPEVDLTENGMTMLENFLREICKFSETYSLDDRIAIAIDHIKQKVKDEKVIVLVSGGVDSAVTAALLIKSLKPENIYAIHVDHGFMRKNESDLICESLQKLGLKNLIRVDAKDVFLNETIVIDGKEVGPLNTVTDPEEKRNIIGHAFIKVVQNASLKLNLDFDQVFLAQGTLRPDLIESGNPDVSVYAHKIKTHHNDVDIIRRAREKGLVVETNADWHKDEVRQVARILGLDEEIASRQPFPGPGLAVRLMCQDKFETIPDTWNTQMDDIIKESGFAYYGKVLPIQSVGVQGDMRSFGNLAVIGSTLDRFDCSFDHEAVAQLAKKITDAIPSVNRVALILNQKPLTESDLANINCHSMYMADENIELLREVDHLTTSALAHCKISQTFSVLLPIGLTKKYSVAVRTFITNDFMTGRPAFIGKDVSVDCMSQLVSQIKEQFEEIEFVMFDITAKPPATCEWQ